MYFIISDIHGCTTALQQALDLYENSDCHYILLLGDILNHGPRNPLVETYDPKACIEQLNGYREQIIAVRGNCDSEVDQMVLQFPMMSDLAIIHLNNRRVIISHGHLYKPDASETFFAEGDIYLHGHYHIPVAERIAGKIILNPGSITLPKGGFEASYGILDEHKFKVLDFAGNTLKELEFNS